jgi:medium-chain acyl-[acyl-carrier-protein] hydrolase
MAKQLTTDRWIQSPRAAPDARLRLFCLPYAGGAASIFRQWPQQLPPQVAVHPVQLPGRENRFTEPPFRALPPLVAALAQVLAPYLDQPFALFGHSMGAILSFELARALHAQGGPNPALLIVSGHGAPQLPDRDPPIHQLPQPLFLEQLQRFNGLPDEVLQHTELLELMLPLLRADFQLIETYVYSEAPPLDCPIVVLGGAHDPTVQRGELDGWRTQTRRTCGVHEFPGDHFFIRSAQAAVIQTLARELASVFRD